MIGVNLLFRWLRYHIAGNFQGRKLSRLRGKREFYGENFRGWCSTSIKRGYWLAYAHACIVQDRVTTPRSAE